MNKEIRNETENNIPERATIGTLDKGKSLILVKPIANIGKGRKIGYETLALWYLAII